MREVGIDITDQTPRLLEYEAAQDSDVVITMGCGDAWPIFPANATRIGNSTTWPAGASTPSGRSATRSKPGSRRYSPT
jgi:protein-tyrosine-phosphatase